MSLKIWIIEVFAYLCNLRLALLLQIQYFQDGCLHKKTNAIEIRVKIHYGGGVKWPLDNNIAINL